ncbi:MAG: spondin domain-containing protein [Pseudomonadota bacterium]
MTRLNAKVLGVVVTALLLQACDSDDSDPVAMVPPVTPPPPVNAIFDVTVTNLTNAQPLSPVAVIAHYSDFAVFTVGQPATVGLEELAEAGTNDALLAEADANAEVVQTASGAAPIGPGGSETITFEIVEDALPQLLLSTSTMLVNTNDAISGINGLLIEDMAVGDVVTRRAIVYDAGTEADTEEAIHIPGPAGGGEGFNATRDDEYDRVAMHIGVVGQDDGLPTSSLNNQHRFDNPAVAFRIERVQ